MLDEPFELFESCRRQPDARTLETDAACAGLLAERTGAVEESLGELFGYVASIEDISVTTRTTARDR